MNSPIITLTPAEESALAANAGPTCPQCDNALDEGEQLCRGCAARVTAERIFLYREWRLHTCNEPPAIDPLERRALSGNYGRRMFNEDTGDQ